MKRDSYSDQHSRARFQPQSLQSEIKPTRFSQFLPHSSSTNNLGATWLDKASSWVADKVQTAQNFVRGAGEVTAPSQILPALRETGSQSDRSHQPLVGVIDSGFGANEHGSKMVETIQHENPQAQIWQGGGVGTGHGLKSLVKFVDTAKATGQAHAVANLSFDLTEVHPDGSISTRSQLTAEEQSALAYARDNGVLVVASSGNQGGAMSALGQASQPFDNLIVVGAADGQNRAAYSSYGKGLDLVAEADHAGTSFAAAKVTGTIASIWNTNPNLSGSQISQILTTSATDINKVGWDAETGAGLLNVKGAIDRAKSTTSAPNVFSGAQLMKQVNGATWKSRDGAIASERPNWSWGDIGHTALDVAGFVPVVGAVADVANGAWYAAEGDYANAAMSMASAVPFVGDAAAAAKIAVKGSKLLKDGEKAAQIGSKVEKAAVREERTIAHSSPSAGGVRSTTRTTHSGASKPSATGTSSGTRTTHSGTTTTVNRTAQPRSGASSRPLGRSSRPESTRPGSSTRPARSTASTHGDRTPQQSSAPHQSRKPSSLNSSQRKPTSAISGRSLGTATSRKLTQPQGARVIHGAKTKPEFSVPSQKTIATSEPKHANSAVVPKTKSGETKPSTQSPWHPSPRKEIDPSPYVRTTHDLTYLNDTGLLSQLDQIRSGESLSEFAKRVKNRIKDQNGNPRQPNSLSSSHRKPTSEISGNSSETATSKKSTQPQPEFSAPSQKKIATSDPKHANGELWLAGHPEHTVRPGETLWDIAERTYGDGRKWTSIRKSDGTAYTSSEARQLRPGTTVHLPKNSSQKTTLPRETGSTNAPNSHVSKRELDQEERSAQRARERLVGVSDPNKTETHAATETGPIIRRGRGGGSRDQELADAVDVFMYKHNIEFATGRPKGSHAERKVFIDELQKNPDKRIIAIGVDRPVCDAGGTSGGECTHFFEDAARVTGKTIVIAEMDPKNPKAGNTWIFRPGAPPEKQTEK